MINSPLFNLRDGHMDRHGKKVEGGCKIKQACFHIVEEVDFKSCVKVDFILI
jgi:hypothetical protein